MKSFEELMNDQKKSKRMRNKGRSARETSHLRGHLAVIDPAQGCEVGGFGTVESVVESGVISVRERDHELALFLSDLREKKSKSLRGSPHNLRNFFTLSALIILYNRNSPEFI